MTPRVIRLGSWHACYSYYSRQKSTHEVEQDLRLQAWLVYYRQKFAGELLLMRCVYGANFPPSQRGIHTGLPSNPRQLELDHSSGGASAV